MWFQGMHADELRMPCQKEGEKQFETFVCCQDPLKPIPSCEDSPLFKVLAIMKWSQKAGPMSWSCGVELCPHEQTTWFKGMHADKLWMSGKKEGDGFQCDALWVCLQCLLSK